MFEDTFNPFPQFDEPSENNNHQCVYGDDGIYGDLPPFDTSAPFSRDDEITDIFRSSTEQNTAAGSHNDICGEMMETSTNEFTSHLLQHSSFSSAREFPQPQPPQKQEGQMAPFSKKSLPQVRTTRHMLISQGSSSSLNSACDSPMGAVTPSASMMLSQFQKVAQQQGTPQTPQKTFPGSGAPHSFVHHQQTPEKFMDDQIQLQFFRHQQEYYMQTVQKQQAQSFHEMSTASEHAHFSQAANNPHFHQQMYLYQRPYFPTVTSHAQSTVQPDTASQLHADAAVSNEQNTITAPVPAMASSLQHETDSSAEISTDKPTKSRSPVSQPKSPISPSETAVAEAKKKRIITRKQRPTINVPPHPQDPSTPSTPAREMLSSPRSGNRRKTLEEKVADAEMAAPLSESTPHTPKSARVTRRRSDFTTSDAGDSPKSKSQMPCSIINCKRMGSRLMESLKGALEQKLKSCPSGRVCEAHYRQDLRAHKKISKRSLDSEFASSTDEFSMGADNTPATPTPSGGSKKRKASSSASTRSSKRAKKI